MQDIAENLGPLPLEKLIKISEANARQTLELLLLVLPLQLHHFCHFLVVLDLVELCPFVGIVLKRENGEVIAGILHTTDVYSFLGRFLQDYVQLFHLQVAVDCQGFLDRNFNIGFILALLDELDVLGEDEELFLNVDIVWESLEELEEFLHREHSVRVIVHYDKHPEINEAQTAVGRVLHQSRVLS